MSTKDPARALVQGLWIGQRLSPMEELSLRSFLAHGHAYRLFVYGPVEGVPEGVEVVDAREVLPEARIFSYREHDSVAGFSNLFRYTVLYRYGGAWADCDLVCLRPLELRAPVVLPSEETHQGYVQRASCFLAAPRGHELLRRAIHDFGQRDPGQLRWGETGPKLITRLAAELGLSASARPPAEFCPVAYSRWEDLVSDERAVLERVLPAVEGAQTVHLWHELWRRAGIDKGARHPPGCLYERLKRRYGVNTSGDRCARGAA